MGRYTTHTAAQTTGLGEKLAATLTGGELIAFSGGLGAGKTTFCQGLAAGLGCRDDVQSPTYAIVNLYHGGILFAHFDAWRIEGPEDLDAAGFYDLRDSGAVIAVEWSERIGPWLEEPFIRVDITVLSPEERQIDIIGGSI